MCIRYIQMQTDILQQTFTSQQGTCVSNSYACCACYTTLGLWQAQKQCRLQSHSLRACLSYVFEPHAHSMMLLNASVCIHTATAEEPQCCSKVTPGGLPARLLGFMRRGVKTRRQSDQIKTSCYVHMWGMCNAMSFCYVCLSSSSKYPMFAWMTLSQLVHIATITKYQPSTAKFN